MRYSVPVRLPAFAFTLSVLVFASIANAAARTSAIAETPVALDPECAARVARSNQAMPVCAIWHVIGSAMARLVPSCRNRSFSVLTRTVNILDGVVSVGSAAADAVGLATHTTAVLSSHTHSIDVAHLAKELEERSFIESTNKIGSLGAVTSDFGRLAFGSHNMYAAEKRNHSFPANSAQSEISVRSGECNGRDALANYVPMGSAMQVDATTILSVEPVGQSCKARVFLRLVREDQTIAILSRRPCREPEARSPS